MGKIDNSKMNFSWSGKQVLVSGAGGFIGSHLTEKLAAKGAEVRAFVRYNSRGDPGLLRQLPTSIIKDIEIIAGDLSDFQAIRQAMNGVEVVFHLGALISIPYSYRHPMEVAETNFMGTLNMLMACKESEISRFVHTSTSEVYGTAMRVPIDESHPLQGQSPYSASKIGADKLAESFFCTYEIPIVTVRPFNTYGPRQSARAVIPTIITQALTQNTIHLGNIDTIRDFTYVGDTVDGFIKAAEKPSIEGQLFNLGSGKEISIGELTELIIHIIGQPRELVCDPIRLRPEKSEVMRLLSDSSRAQESLGWKAQVSIEQVLQLTIDWIQNHINHYRIGEYEF